MSPKHEISADDVVALVTGARDSEIIGCYETQDVDFKGQYRLTEPSEKWELAKDIAAFANNGGGVIAVGFRTEMDDDRAEELVTEVRPVPPALFDPKQIIDIAKEWVYPPPNIEPVRHPRGDKALGTIRIHPVEADAPYLVTRMPTDEDRYPAQSAVGWPRRMGTHTSWNPVGQIHRHLQGNQRTSGGETSATTQPVSTVTSEAPDEEALLGSLDREMGWGDRAVMFLTAMPALPQPSPIPGFYSAEDGVLRAVQRPKELRWAGFTLTYGHQVETDDDGRIISSDDERAFVLHPNGVTIAALSAAPHFLTRGGGDRDPSAPAPRTINPVVVTEWTYLFCDFVSSVLAVSVPGEWKITVGLRGAKNRPWSLAAAPGLWTSPNRHLFRGDSVPARLDNWKREFQASLDPGLDSYALLSALYELFGLNYDDVGFAENSAVNPKTIAEVAEKPKG